MQKSEIFFVSTIWVVGTLLLCPLTTKCNKYEQFLDVFSSWVYQIQKIFFSCLSQKGTQEQSTHNLYLGNKKFPTFWHILQFSTGLSRLGLTRKYIVFQSFFISYTHRTLINRGIIDMTQLENFGPTFYYSYLNISAENLCIIQTNGNQQIILHVLR